MSDPTALTDRELTLLRDVAKQFPAGLEYTFMEPDERKLIHRLVRLGLVDRGKTLNRKSTRTYIVTISGQSFLDDQDEWIGISFPTDLEILFALRNHVIHRFDVDSRAWVLEDKLREMLLEGNASEILRLEIEQQRANEDFYKAEQGQRGRWWSNLRAEFKRIGRENISLQRWDNEVLNPNDRNLVAKQNALKACRKKTEIELRRQEIFESMDQEETRRFFVIERDLRKKREEARLNATHDPADLHVGTVFSYTSGQGFGKETLYAVRTKSGARQIRLDKQLGRWGGTASEVRPLSKFPKTVDMFLDSDGRKVHNAIQLEGLENGDAFFYDQYKPLHRYEDGFWPASEAEKSKQQHPLNANDFIQVDEFTLVVSGKEKPEQDKALVPNSAESHRRIEQISKMLAKAPFDKNTRRYRDAKGEIQQLEEAIKADAARSLRAVESGKLPDINAALPFDDIHDRDEAIHRDVLKALPDGSKITNGEFIGMSSDDRIAATGEFSHYEKINGQWFEVGTSKKGPLNWQKVTLGSPVLEYLPAARYDKEPEPSGDRLIVNDQGTRGIYDPITRTHQVFLPNGEIETRQATGERNYKYALVVAIDVSTRKAAQKVVYELAPREDEINAEYARLKAQRDNQRTNRGWRQIDRQMTQHDFRKLEAARASVEEEDKMFVWRWSGTLEAHNKARREYQAMWPHNKMITVELERVQSDQRQAAVINRTILLS